MEIDREMNLDLREAFSELEEVYRRLDRQLERTTVHCVRCGKCCNFDTNGMKLYIFRLEREYLQARLSNPLSLLNGVCSGQQGKMCAIHAIRPLGCRTQFCTHTFDEWYERTAREIMQIEKKYGIPYHYADAFV